MKIESTDLSVENLLKGSFFVIPRFQRPYSWEEDNIDDFWNDIAGTNVPEYFIGSMVVYKLSKNTLGVVDGQQRLTTIMILLCSLRDAFSQLEQHDKALGLQGFVERTNRDNRTIFVLQTESSFPFFQETILKYGESQLHDAPGKEEDALAKASDIFRKNISNKLNSIDGDSTIKKSKKLQSKLAWLTKLRDAILELNIILVTLDSENDAYLIFETLNTRGKDLALSDLVRNLFTRLLKPTGDVDHAKIKWDTVLETIANSSEDLEPDNFIVHSWQSRFSAVTKAKAYQNIGDVINIETAMQHLDDFIFDAECYRRIFEPSFAWDRNESEVRRSLEAYRLFKLIQPTPAILALVRAYKMKNIRLSKLKKTLAAIENFHFGFTAVTSSRSSGGISGMYSSFGRRLFEASSPNQASQEIRALISKLRERVPAANEFDAAFEQIIYTRTATTHRLLVRYILLRLTKLERLPFTGASEDLTIEHLVPQESIGDVWPIETVGQIGNLMLVDGDTNENLSTKSFSEKRKILEKNGYRLPEEFRRASKLTAKAIERRTKNIAQKAREEIWKVK